VGRFLERRSVLSGIDKPEIVARRLFLVAIEDYAPEALESLYSDVFPLCPSRWTYMQQFEQEMGLTFIDEALEYHRAGVLPTDYANALVAWLARWYLTEDWLMDVAGLARRYHQSARALSRGAASCGEGAHLNLVADLRHALDPVAFAVEALDLDLDDWQAEVLRSTGKRDLLNVTRQGGKSTVAAVLGLHTALYRPKSLTLVVSPSERQSKELFKKIIDLREVLPEQPRLLEDNKLSMEVAGGGRVVSLPGSEATVRGFSGASLIVEDEAARVPDELYMAVRPMLATSGGRLILMSTPCHFKDEVQHP
jgi:hypothetical protein